ncbi:TIGR01244 family sulfur transferase [Marinobacter sp. X15-166B]|uniref:TIGR01244 family sulfur transferase n=1 Tax=Marinobacter sp. X15-166B TaxID=1897620 RepID=UPI00085C311E|nr:TIGR01244 family sulfur transferase [Marinobacter sp. X15-166B]OEY67643.1 TIGR01244 family protein [Marinobacter sp. X15-166B]
MDFRKIDEDISVSPQLTLGDIVEAAKLGFRTVIANRPDGEEFGQLSMADLQAATHANGMEWVYLPVDSGNITDTNIDDFTAIYEQAEKPVLAFCRSGTRCCVLWALSRATEAPAETILSKAGQAGYNLTALTARLMQRARHAG